MKKQFNISIPKPCHEDWSKMTPKEKGRFCGSCSKTVIDFTKKSKEEIQDYLSQNFGKRVCGHFYTNQLDTITLEIPRETFQQQLSFQKLFILALLFVMGTTLFSCQYSDGKKQKIENVVLIDSLENIETKIDSIQKLKCNTQKDSLKEIEGEIIPPLPIVGKMNIVEGDLNFTPIKDKVIGLSTVEEPPRFKESEKLSRREAKKEFQDKMKKFFVDRFKAPQAYMDLPKGRYRIYTLFVIDTYGKVTDVKIRAPHSTLKKQIEKIIAQLPEFVPGKQNGKVIKTRYTLPISFEVEE
jgi:hypothetical protein